MGKITEFAEYIKQQDELFKCQLLDRMLIDCKYYLSFGYACEKRLWGLNVHDHILYMKIVYIYVLEKPEWLTMDQIITLGKQMRNHKSSDPMLYV